MSIRLIKRFNFPPSIRPYSLLRKENIWTVPNLLSASRVAAAPIISLATINHNFPLAICTLGYCALSDFIDGYLARRWKQESVLGSVIDPIGDKLLIGTLASSLAYIGLFPVPLIMLVLGRDLGLILSGFYIRYKSLPQPSSLKSFFDPRFPSAEVKPSIISKVNTCLQLTLLGGTLFIPIFDLPLNNWPIVTMRWLVAGTTIWSGTSYYILHKEAVKYLLK